MRLKKYLTEIDASVFKDMNKGVYKGKKFWSGVYSLRKNNIVSTTTYEEAEKNDFHHSFYIKDNLIKEIANGSALFFWVEFTGVLNADWHINIGDNKSRAVILKQIKKKIKIIK